MRLVCEAGAKQVSGLAEDTFALLSEPGRPREMAAAATDGNDRALGP